MSNSDSLVKEAYFIDFVGYEHLDDIWLVGERLELAQPDVQLVEGVSTRYVVYKDGTLSTSVVAWCECSETLLTGRVLMSRRNVHTIDLTINAAGPPRKSR